MKSYLYVGSLRNQILKINTKQITTLIIMSTLLMLIKHHHSNFTENVATILDECGFLIPLPKTLTCLRTLLTVSINWSVSANSKMHYCPDGALVDDHAPGREALLQKGAGIRRQRWSGVVLFQTGNRCTGLHEVWCGRQWWCCATRGSCMWFCV